MPRPSKNNASGAAVEPINAAPDGLKIVLKELKSLVPFARNPRAHSDEQVAQIAASIKEFGLTNPILLDGENGLIAVNTRIYRVLELRQRGDLEAGQVKRIRNSRAVPSLGCRIRTFRNKGTIGEVQYEAGQVSLAGILFHLTTPGHEERSIHTNPAARVTSLHTDVFGR